MVMRAAAMMKVNFVLDIARKDNRFFKDLTNDPFRTLCESGIDLSQGETLAIIDIIHNTSVSTLASHLEKSRKNWTAICSERGGQKQTSATRKRAPKKKATKKATKKPAKKKTVKKSKRGKYGR